MANVKISALPAATSVASADVLPIVQSATTKKATIQNVSDALGVTTTVANTSPGLVFVSSTNIGTGVASVTVSNCFSSAYDNYRITVTGGLASGSSDTSLQLTGITGNVYQITGFYMTPGQTTINGYSPAATSFFLLGSINSIRYAHIFDLISPFLTQQKFMVGMNGLSTSGVYNFSGHCTSTSSASGFTITANGGQTLTGGTITVYGYRK